MGSATAWWLARRGCSVALIDRFEAGHHRGSSHGTERIFRLVYPEPDYVRLAAAALPLWRELEADAGEQLLETTGCLDLGPMTELEPLAGACAAAGVPVEWVTPAELADRWPGLRAAGPSLLQRDGGRTFADRAVAALRRRAGELGADVHDACRVTAVTDVDGGVEVRTEAGALHGRIAVITAAGWTHRLLPAWANRLPPITCTLEQAAWFDPVDPALVWPSFIWHESPAAYGMGMPDGRVKVGEHGTGPVVDPDDRALEPDPRVLRRVGEWAARWVPGVVPEPVGGLTCLYAATPTDDFVLDRHGPIVVGAGFGGHGFKFAPLVGRILADLVVGRPGPGGRFGLRA
jgi:sarcosine oxidase